MTAASETARAAEAQPESAVTAVLPSGAASPAELAANAIVAEVGAAALFGVPTSLPRALQHLMCGDLPLPCVVTSSAPASRSTLSCPGARHGAAIATTSWSVSVLRCPRAGLAEPSALRAMLLADHLAVRLCSMRGELRCLPA